MSLFIGIMSGTSLDGIDIALVQQSENGAELISAHTYPLATKLVAQLQSLITDPKILLAEYGKLHIALGIAFADAVNQHLAESPYEAADIVAIGSHGQTIFHAPSGDYPFSLQLGDPSTISERTGITTVADFRARDIAAGGQGAPLVPAFHRAHFHTEKQPRIIVNIGGISNITVLATTEAAPIIGFDTGPGNALLDSWFQQHNIGQYDADGAWATSGKVQPDLLQHLLADPFFELPAPKSTGREYFNLTWLHKNIALFNCSAVDVQATLVTLTAQSISTAAAPYLTAGTALYLCGGGAHNSSLKRAIQRALPYHNITDTSAIGLSPDWVEACAFAWLAAQTVSGGYGNLPDVTGAAHSVILGGIYPA